MTNVEPGSAALYDAVLGRWDFAAFVIDLDGYRIEAVLSGHS